MAAALQHEAATLSPWIEAASNGKHHPHGAKTNDALTFKPDQSVGAGHGYKWHDKFDHRHGLTEANYGSSIMFVIDPTAAPNVRVKPFGDLKEGAEFLTWKRSL